MAGFYHKGGTYEGGGERVSFFGTSVTQVTQKGRVNPVMACSFDGGKVVTLENGKSFTVPAGDEQEHLIGISWTDDGPHGRGYLAFVVDETIVAMLEGGTFVQRALA